jgi:hypothetical protein
MADDCTSIDHDVAVCVARWLWDNLQWDEEDLFERWCDLHGLDADAIVVEPE